MVERREFENALTLGGRDWLTTVLLRQRTPGFWVVLVEADGTGTLCADNEYVLGTDSDCTISESTAELTVTQGPNPDYAATLQGSETLIRGGNLETVNTYQFPCLPDVAPTNCAATNTSPFQFTRTGLNPVIPVLPGDRIDVTVEISFN